MERESARARERARARKQASEREREEEEEEEKERRKTVCVSHAEKFHTGQGLSELLHFLSLRFRVMTAARLTAPVLASPCPGLFKARECYSTQ
jgi:hypothetical protein